MNETIQLLQDVVRGARTGENAVGHLVEKAQTEGMRAELAAERDRYRDQAEAAERALREAGGQPEPLGMMARAGMWMGTEMETLTDRTDAHIAELVIQGATMGVIEITHAMNMYEYAEDAARGAASGFVVCQQEIIERQKRFLRDPVRA